MAVQINVVGQYSGRDIAKAQRDLAKLADGGDKLADRMQRSGSKVADTIGNIAKVAGAAGAALLAKGFVDALSFDGLEDKLGAQLGLTAEQSEAMGDVAGRLYADAYGESLEAVFDAVGTVESSLGRFLDGTEVALEGATAKALDLATAFDVDVTEAVNAAGVAVESGLADDVDHAFDLIVKSMQDVPAAMRGEMIPIVEEYAQHFGALGIGGEEAFALMVDAAQEGRFELDKVGDALKELTIRGTDMSTASVEAFEAAGLSADDMTARFLEGGDSARGALEDLTMGLLNIEDPAEQANAAIALFGTPLEDMSTDEIPEFLVRLSSMEDQLLGSSGAAEAMGDTLNDNLGVKLEALKRGALTRLATFLEDRLIPFLENTVGPWFEKHGPAAIAVATTAFDAVAAGVEWVRDNSEWLIPVLGGVLAGYLAFQVVAGIQAGITAATAAWTAAQTALNVAMTANPIGLVVAALAALAAGLVIAWNHSDTFRAVVSGAFTGLRDGVLAAVNFMIRAVNALIGLWNGLEFTLPKVHVPGTNIDIGGFTVGTPDIPTISEITVGGPAVPVAAPSGFRGQGGVTAFAEGGIVTRPTLALISEAGDDEAVIPLPSDWRRNGLGGGAPTLTLNLHVDARGAGAGAGAEIRQAARLAADEVLELVLTNVYAGAGAA